MKPRTLGLVVQHNEDVTPFNLSRSDLLISIHIHKLFYKSFVVFFSLITGSDSLHVKCVWFIDWFSGLRSSIGKPT